MLILTFDIEDWFNTNLYRRFHSGHIWDQLPTRVEMNTNRILHFLEQHNKKATFFVLGWIAERYPKLVNDIVNAGHEIGAHSTWHHDIRLLTPEDFEKDLKRNLDVLENITGEKVTIYRAPDFSLQKSNKVIFNILSANGIKVDSSIKKFTIRENKPHIIQTDYDDIIEFPLFRTWFGFPYSGGGYFRVLPVDVLNLLFRSHNYNMLYLHPKDIDKDTPTINVFSTFRNWFNRFNVENTLEKLSFLLTKNESSTLGEAAKDFINEI